MIVSLNETMITHSRAARNKMKSTAHPFARMCPGPQLAGSKAVLLHFHYMQEVKFVKHRCDMLFLGGNTDSPTVEERLCPK